MVEMRLRKIRHKKGEAYWTSCGIYYGRTDPPVPPVRDQWRWVTCKRCLRSKPKKK